MCTFLCLGALREDARTVYGLGVDLTQVPKHPSVSVPLLREAFSTQHTQYFAHGR